MPVTGLDVGKSTVTGTSCPAAGLASAAKSSTGAEAPVLPFPLTIFAIPLRAVICYGESSAEGCARADGISGQMRTFAGVNGKANGTNGGNGRLKGWKAVAAHFGTDERTVKRWEAQRGLPVRRVPGSGKASVYADIAELDAWLAGQDGRERAPDPAPPPISAPRRWRWALPTAALGALGLAMVFVAQGGDALSAPFARTAPSRAAQDAYLAAAHSLERRTPADIARAIDGFGQAIAAEPAYADAYAGLAMAHLLQREFGAVAAEPAYARAAAAAERAIELDPDQAEGHAALGFATFYGQRDFVAGLASLEHAVELDPASGRTLHWYATALYHAGDLSQALAMLERAQRRTPGSPAIVSDKALILYAMGRREEALGLLDQIAAERPEFSAPHRYRALIAQAEQDWPVWLAKGARTVALENDAKLAAEVAAGRKALEAGGATGLARAMLAPRSGARPLMHYEQAIWLSLAGDKDAAFAALDRAFAAQESLVTAIRIDPRLQGLRSDPRYPAYARRAGGAD